MPYPLATLRHSAAHVLAQAVMQLFPDARLGMGPAIEDGFFYDFGLPRALSESDLEQLEQRMRAIIAEDQPFERQVVSKREALEAMAAQPFKRELIEVIEQGGLDENLEPIEGELELSLYRNPGFVDLCRGPHVARTGEIDPAAIKLLSVSAAYWRGDDQRDQLQRVYGTAWHSADELEDYLRRREEAKKRDHRVLGRRLEYYLTSDAVGQGLVLWQPKGALVRYLAERFSQDAHVLNGYDWVYTPHIGKERLWQTSGHLDFYKDSMYAPLDIDGDRYYLKPMSCPFHLQIFKHRPRSYRELPLRFAEFANVYRYELSGTLQGMTRVRGFTQDDAHTFCRPEQAKDEARHALRFSMYVLREFGLSDFKAYVSTRPAKKYIGDPEAWSKNERVLEEILREEGVPYAIDEGGGAFYGPKIDLKVRDSLQREWQLSTVQFDFNLPERFDLAFIGDDGRRHRPVMIHRALFGSAERFFALLFEHYAGALPLWLAPTQVVIATVTEHQLDYAREVAALLSSEGLRVKVDESGDRIGAKIRVAEEEKTPFILVLGKREAANATISVRKHREGDLGAMSIEAFLEHTSQERSRGRARRLDDPE